MEKEFEELKSEEISEEDVKEIEDKIIHNPNEIKLKFYENFRKKLTEKIKKTVGKKSAQGFEYLMFLPDFFVLFTRLLLDERVKTSDKAFIGGIVAYLIMPFDIIPDFIPVIGYVDDIAVVVYGLNMLFNHMEKQIILDNWSGEADLLQLVQSLTAKTSDFLNKNVVDKIRFLLDKLAGKNNETL